MSHQHHTINSPRSIKQVCLTDRGRYGRGLNGRGPYGCGLLILIFMLSTGFTAAVYADGAQRTRAQAVDIAKSRSGNGRVLSVKKTVNKQGKSVFAVKIIVNGRVKIYAIPESTN